MARVSSPRLVGRREELARLLEIAGSEGARQRHQGVLLYGEAGIGKTRLLLEFRHRVEMDGVLVLAGACLAGPSGPPLTAVTGLVRDLRMVLGADRASGRRDSSLTDHVAQLEAMLAGTAEVGSASPGRIYELAQAVVERLAEKGPLALMVEDLHWADSVTLGLLGFLARQSRVGRLTMIASYRSDELHRRHPLHAFLADFERRAAAEWIELRRLTRSELAEMAEAITGRLLDRQSLDRLVHRSQGNPFYAEELLAAGVPSDLRNIVLERVSRLGEADYQLLRTASVSTAPLDATVLAEAAGREPAEVEQRLQQMVEYGHLVNGDEGPTFRHELTREMLYQELLPSARRRLHLGYAEAVARGVGERPAELARHLWEAGDRRRALPASILAAKDAERRGAAADALVFYERALQLVDETGDRGAAERTEMALAAGEMAMNCRLFDRAIYCLERELTREHDANSGARLWLRLGLARMLGPAPIVGCRAAAEQALRILQGEPASELLIEALVMAADFEWRGGRPRRALELTSQAERLGEQVGASPAAISCTAAAARSELLDPTSSTALEALASDYRTGGNQKSELDALFTLAHVQLRLDRRSSVLDTSERLIELTRAEGNYLTSGIWAEFHRVIALDGLGRWAEALAHGEETADLIGGLDSDWIDGIAWALGPLLVRRGDARAAEILRRGWAVSIGSEVCATQVGRTAVAMIELAARDGDEELVVAITEQALDVLLPGMIAPATEVVATATGAAAELGLARPGARASLRRCATAWHARLAPALDGLPVAGHITQVWLEKAGAELERLGQHSDADRWIALADAWTSASHPYEAAYAHYRAAERLLMTSGLRRQGSDAASQHLRRAWSTLRKLEATVLLTDVEQLARRARITLGGDTTEKAGAIAVGEQLPWPLTERELDVLRLLAGGSSNGEIGKTLFITTKTASTHVSNILRKMGAANRVEAATIAQRLGVVD